MPLVEADSKEIPFQAFVEGPFGRVSDIIEDPRTAEVIGRAKALRSSPAFGRISNRIRCSRSFHELKIFSSENVELPDGVLDLARSGVFLFCTFAEEDFDRFDFSECVFVHCNFVGATFSCCRIEDSIFEDCRLTGCRFIDCSLIRARFTSEDPIRAIDFSKKCDLDYAVFEDSTIQASRLNPKRGLRGSQLRRVKFQDCDLSDLDLTDCTIEEIKIDELCNVDNLVVSNQQLCQIQPMTSSEENKNIFREIVVDGTGGPSLFSRIDAVVFAIDAPRVARLFVNLSGFAATVSLFITGAVVVGKPSIENPFPVFVAAFGALFLLLTVPMTIAYFPRVRRRLLGWRRAVTC